MIAAPEVGSYIELDTNVIGRRLLGGDLPCGSWTGCDFRWPNPIRDWEVSRAIACNVKVTGRKIRRRNGANYVRVQIEWVGDCEPSTFSGGWMLVE